MPWMLIRANHGKLCVPHQSMATGGRGLPRRQEAQSGVSAPRSHPADSGQRLQTNRQRQCWPRPSLRLLRTAGHGHHHRGQEACSGRDSDAGLPEPALPPASPRTPHANCPNILGLSFLLYSHGYTLTQAPISSCLDSAPGMNRLPTAVAPVSKALGLGPGEADAVREAQVYELGLKG